MNTSVAFAQKFILYPPRPEGSIPPDSVNRYQGWVAQRKWNGTRNLIYVLPDGGYELYNRHRGLHKQYRVSKSMDASIRELVGRCKRGVFSVFDSELMDAKTRTLKDRIVLYDVLVHDGQYLLGSTYRDRFDLLFRLLGNPTQYETDTGKKLALRFNQNLWLSELFTDKFKDRYDEALALDEIEGLVLKDPNGKLEFGIKESNNGSWLIRVRKRHKNYEW